MTRAPLVYGQMPTVCGRHDRCDGLPDGLSVDPIADWRTDLPGGHPLAQTRHSASSPRPSLPHPSWPTFLRSVDSSSSFVILECKRASGKGWLRMSLGEAVRLVYREAPSYRLVTG